MSDAINPIVLIGGFGSHWTDYNSMGKYLARVSGRRVFIANINRLSWVVGGFTDYFLVCSGSNPRQIQTIADEVQDQLEKIGQRVTHIDR